MYLKRVLAAILALASLLCLTAGISGCKPGTDDPKGTPAPTDPALEKKLEEEIQAFVPKELGTADISSQAFYMSNSCGSEDGYSNLNLGDGDKKTGFTTARGNSAKETPAENSAYFIFADLTEKRELASLELYPMEKLEEGFPVSFELYLSDDGENYEKIGEYNDNRNVTVNEGLKISLEGKSARFVKLVTTKINSLDKIGYAAILSEFRIFAKVTTAQNHVTEYGSVWLYKNPDTPYQIKLKGYRIENGAGTLRYLSKDSSVASVDAAGLVTPVGYGDTEIYLYDGENLSTLKVRVIDDTSPSYRFTTFYHSTFLKDPQLIGHVLDIYRDAGINYIEDTRIYDYSGNQVMDYMIFRCAEKGMFYSGCDILGDSNYRKMSDEEIIDNVKKYEFRAGFMGLYLQDEPHSEYLEYAHVFSVMQGYNPHVTPHLNLLPPYNFGGSSEYFWEFAAEAGINGNMHYLSFDMYPFLWSNTFNTQAYECYEMMRNAGLMYNAKTGYYMQAMQITNQYKLLNRNQHLFNATLGIIYGFKNFKYFVALTPLSSGEAFTMGLISPEYEPAADYEYIIEANQMIKKAEPYLAACDAVEVYSSSTIPNTEKAPKDFAFGPAKGSAFYTLYVNPDGTQYIVISNSNYAVKKGKNYTIPVKEDLNGLTLCSEAGLIPLDLNTNHELELSIEPGQFLIIKLPDGYDARLKKNETRNLALGKGVFTNNADTQFWDSNAIATKYITDGKTDGKGGWQSQEGFVNPLLILDLGQIEKFNEIDLYSGKTVGPELFPDKITVYVSNDGKEYKEVCKFSGGKPEIGTAVPITFDAQEARFIKLEFIAEKAVGISELEVYNR